MKINIQSKSTWLENVPLLNTCDDVVVRLISVDGVSLPIPVSFLAASSEYLSSLLPSNCSICCSNTVIHLPSVSGLSLKLFYQIINEGETEQLSGDDIESCLEKVEDVLALLGCKVKVVTKLSCKRASDQIRVVSTESLAQDNFVKEEYKEIVEVFKNEDMEDFESQLEVNGEVKVENSGDYFPERESLECFVRLRTVALQEEVCGNSDSWDMNQNMLVKDWEPSKRSISGETGKDKVKQCSVCQKYFSSRKLFIEHCKHAHFLQDTPSLSTWSNPKKVRSQKKGSRINDKEWFKNARREFQCSFCNLGFFTSAGLERHTSDKHGDNYPNREFKCLECDLSYYTENSLDKHKYEKHGSEHKKDQANTSASTSTRTCDNLENPFSCTVNLCDYSCNSLGRIVKHWNQKHTKVASEASFMDTATSTTVTLYQAFAFILQCRLCGIVRCSKYKKYKAVWGMTEHLNNHHSGQTGTGNLPNLYSVLQENLQISEPVSDAKIVLSLEQRHVRKKTAVKVPTVRKKTVVKVPTVAEFTTKQSFSKKGYLGPYHCLREGCSFVCDKFGLTTQKLLVKHWSEEHGNIKPLLYLDMSSFTIINVKIICNNVAYCSHVGCDHLTFASKTFDFRNYVLNHWKNSHSTSNNSFTPNMCKAISDKHVPDITEEEAVALAKRSNFSSKSWAHDDGIPVSSGILNEEEYLKMRRLLVDTSLMKASEQDGRTSLKCEICGKKWVGNSSKEGRRAVRHMGLHLQVRVRCSLCKVSLKSLESFYIHKSKFCKNKPKSQVAFVDKERKEENDKILDIEDSSKDKRLSANSRGKLDISAKRVTESTGLTLMMNDDEGDKFGQEKVICFSENITTEKEQNIEESKNKGRFKNTDENLYDDVVVDDVSHDSPDDMTEENQSDSHKFKDFKCPLKCSSAFTEKAHLLNHLKYFHRFNNETVKKIIKLNPWDS